MICYNEKSCHFALSIFPCLFVCFFFFFPIIVASVLFYSSTMYPLCVLEQGTFPRPLQTMQYEMQGSSEISWHLTTVGPSLLFRQPKGRHSSACEKR